MPSITTLGEFIAEGGYITAFCENYPCRHRREMDMADLVARLGPDFDMFDPPRAVQRRLRCSACGAKQASIILSRKDTKLMTGTHSADSMRIKRNG